VVDLVEPASCQEPLRIEFDRFPFEVCGPHRHGAGASHLALDPWEREAPLLAGDHVVGVRDDRWIEEYLRCVGPRRGIGRGLLATRGWDMRDEQSPGEPYLGRCEPDAVGAPHQLDHAVGHGADPVAGLDRIGLGAQDLGGIDIDSEARRIDSHRPIVCPRGPPRPSIRAAPGGYTPCPESEGVVRPLALFGKKKEADAAEGDAPAPADLAFSPKKAKAFFDRAKTVHDSENYEYAMQLWLNGLRQDPSDMDGFKGYLRSAEVYAAENPKKGVSRETRSAISAKGALGKYIEALLEFGLKRMDLGVAIKATDAASRLNLGEPTKALGEHALTLAKNNAKTKKDHFVKLLNAFERVEVFQLAAVAGESACQLDPTDGELQMRVRNMLAAGTMSRGGYDDLSEGGFRKNIRDADKQQELIEADAISKTESTKDQIVARTQKAYEERPEDVPSINAYATAMLDRGRNADEKTAISLLLKAHKLSGQFKFRQRAGEVQVRRAQKMIAKLEAQAEQDPGNEELREKLEHGRAAFEKLRMDELALQVEKYPTDLNLKYRLGKLLFEKGEYNDAIEQFQQAQNEPKLKHEVLALMGKSFMRLGGWEDAAIQTFRQAIEGVRDETSDLGMELRYALMDALTVKAKKESHLPSAEEADQIAAAIAIQRFTYRDVRERRDEIRALIEQIKG